MRPGKNDFQSRRCFFDFGDHRLDAVAVVVFFPGRLETPGKNTFGFSQIHENRTVLLPLEIPDDHLPDLILEFGIQGIFLNFPEILPSLLFGALDRSAVEFPGIYLDEQLISDLTVLVEFQSLGNLNLGYRIVEIIILHDNLSGVDEHLVALFGKPDHGVFSRTEGFLVGREEKFFDGGQNQILGDSPFRLYRSYGFHEISIHYLLLTLN